jgi:hypothetical protein
MGLVGGDVDAGVAGAVLAALFACGAVGCARIGEGVGRDPLYKGIVVHRVQQDPRGHRFESVK